MTTTPRYATLDDLRDYLSADGLLGTYQDGLLTDALVRAEGQIDAYTRRSFTGNVGTRYYSRYTTQVAGNQALYLTEDLINLDYAENGVGQVIPLGSIYLEPRNLGPPYRIIRLHVSAYTWVWNTDQDAVFAGTWGYSAAPPEPIRQAAVRWAAYIFRQKDTGMTDVAGFPDAGEVAYPKGMPDDIRGILSPYRSRSGGVV